MHHVVRLTNNKGLAAAFQAGLDACLKLGADVIVNTDADNQYYGGDIPKLVAPILAGEADMVVGDRETDQIEHFSPLKKRLQRLGSAVVAPRVRAPPCPTPPPASAPTTARPRCRCRWSRSSPTRSRRSSRRARCWWRSTTCRSAPTRKTRESRLFPSMWAYVRRNAGSIFRIYSLYEPMRVFFIAAAVVAVPAAVIWARFLYFFFSGEGEGHVQSLILGSTLLIIAVQLVALGVIGDILAGSRVLQQRTLERVRRVELQLGVEPSHYEPARRRHRHHGRGAGRPPASARTGARSCRGVTASPRRPTGRPDRQHLRQVRLDQPGRAAADGRLPRARSTSCGSRRRRASVLDVGCGEGVLTHEWAERLGDGRIVGIDLDDPKLRAEWDTRRRREPRVPRSRRPRALSFADDEFDMATAIEVLEHVPDPEATVAEMARVAERWLLVSVPREPLWRGLNMARGAYWGSLGNTPGPREPLVQALVRADALAPRRRSRRRARRSPGRCCSSGSSWRPPRLGLRPRRRDPLGRDRRPPGSITYALLLARQPHAVGGRLRRDHAAVVGGVHHRVGALPAGRAAAVAHDRRPRRARARPAREHLRVAATIQLALGVAVRGRSRWRCAGRSRTTCSTARRRSTGC